MADTWAKIDERINVLGDFYNQVDRTRKRLNLEPYALTRFDSTTKLDDVINVTENKSATYMARIIASLMSAKWQMVVEGDKKAITAKEAHKIELFIESNLNQADEYVFQEYGLAGLDSWLVNHVCHTSLIGVHWMSYLEEDEYKIHCLPIDMRWSPFVLNKWAAPITFRTKDDLLAELEGYAQVADGADSIYHGPGLGELKDIDNEVRDYWDKDKNELWVEKQLVFSQKNIYGKLPFVFVWTPSGFMFRDKGYLAHESPSLLFLNENLYDQLSRQLSIDATLGFEPVLPSYEYETEEPGGGVSRPVPKRGQTLEVPKGELHRPVPRGDVNRAQIASRDEIGRLIDEAAPLAPRAYNTPPSAIEVATEVELLSELQNPRIVALQMFKQRLARLIIEQCQLIAGKGSKSFSVGKIGQQKSFSYADLGDPARYSITYQLMKQNKRLAIVNEARALALRGWAPQKFILRDILGVEDPDGWAREMELEKAKLANPALSLVDMAVRYEEEAEGLEGAEKDLKNWESMMLVHDYVMLMRQRLQPAMSAEMQNVREATKQGGSAQPLVSLLGRSAGALPQPPGEVAKPMVGRAMPSEME